MSKPSRAALPMLAAVLSFTSGGEAAGQDGNEGFPAARGMPVENLVVTASRVPVPLHEVGSSMTVITRAELEARQPTFVADALRDVAGISVSRGGGFGAVTQLRIRGAEGNHALVLIDGVEANNPVANSEFDFANLLVADIERIEILRGAQSALYGSDAVGGVVNVITRERGPGLDAEVNAEGGSFGTHALGLSVGGGADRYSGGLSLTRFATDGQNFARSGGERDGFENEALTLNGRALLGEAVSVKATLRYIDSEQDFDTQDFSFPPTPTQGLLVDDDVSSDLTEWFARVEAAAKFGRLEHLFGVSGTGTKNRFFDAGAATGRNEGGKTKLDYQVTLGLGGSSAEGAGDAADAGDRALTLALERELVDYENLGATPTAPETQTRHDTQTSVVAEYRTSLARAGFSASVRYDDNELFDDASTYRLAGTFSIDDRTRLHTSVGTGIANPGFFDLFGFFPGSFIGNPALRPERSTNFDAGVERLVGDDGRLDVTYFRANLEDEIETTFDSATFLSSVRNLDGESERRGVELSGSAAVTERWQVAAAYTYTDAEQPDGGAELRRPRHVASLDNTLRFAGGRARVHVGIDHSGAQQDAEFVLATPEERVSLPGFTVVNVAADVGLSAHLSLYGRVENLLDEEYEEWFSYRGRGRSLVAGFTLDLVQ